MTIYYKIFLLFQFNIYFLFQKFSHQFPAILHRNADSHTHKYVVFFTQLIQTIDYLTPSKNMQWDLFVNQEFLLNHQIYVYTILIQIRILNISKNFSLHRALLSMQRGRKSSSKMGLKMYTYFGHQFSMQRDCKFSFKRSFPKIKKKRFSPMGYFSKASSERIHSPLRMDLNTYPYGVSICIRYT